MAAMTRACANAQNRVAMGATRPGTPVVWIPVRTAAIQVAVAFVLKNVIAAMPMGMHAATRNASMDVILKVVVCVRAIVCMDAMMMEAA